MWSCWSAKARGAGPEVTQNAEAYRYFLIGRAFQNRVSLVDSRRAVEAYEHATTLDPGYAPAWSGLALSMDLLAWDANTLEAGAAFRRRAQSAAERAVTLAPDLPDALLARAQVRQNICDWEGARNDIERAVQLSPGSSDAVRHGARLLGRSGRLGEALVAAKQAVELDPLSAA